VDKIFFVKNSKKDGYLHPERIYANFIKPLIWEGLVCKQIMRCCNISDNTIKKFIYTYGTKNDIDKIKNNLKHIRSTVYKKVGRTKKKPYDCFYPTIKSYVLKGYTTNDIQRNFKEKYNKHISPVTVRNIVKRFNEKEIVKLLYKNGWNKVRETSMRIRTKRVSKIELEFCNIIQQYFPEAIGSYSINSFHGFNWIVDVALPKHKIAFEYDGIYWHTKEKDNRKDLDLAKQGWQVIRFPYGPTPKTEVLEQDFINKARELNLL
jgi:CRISPR/Cas system CSM-associated protein Csm2 small subunit